MDDHSAHQDVAPKRRRVTFTVRADLIAQAQALKLNASRAAEAGLESAIKEARAKAWLAKNTDAIRAHNARIATSGMLITPLWLRR